MDSAWDEEENSVGSDDNNDDRWDFISDK